ncbi:MAG: hypothetical protein AAGH67_07495 [Cyanobacteria bacterium P01_H01_bin.162]
MAADPIGNSLDFPTAVRLLSVMRTLARLAIAGDILQLGMRII